MISKRKNGLIAAIALIATLLSGASYLFLFQGALKLDENHIQNHLSILKLEASRQSTVVIDGDRDRLLTRNFDSAKAHIEGEGWQFVDQFGATLVFEKQNPQQRLYASCGLYSPPYMTCGACSSLRLSYPSRR